MIMIRAWTVFLFKLLILISCYNSTDKKNVDKVNDERFENKQDSKEARFLVDIIDRSYGILELAQLGEEKMDDPLMKVQAKQIVQNQTSVGLRFKTFAEQNDVTIPLSGPEKTKSKVKNLYDKSGDEFMQSWTRQLDDMHKDFSNQIVDFRDDASGPLQVVLDSTLIILKQNEEAILALDKTREQDQN